MIRMLTRAAAISFVVTAVTAAAAAQAQDNGKKETPSVAGAWTVSVDMGDQGTTTMPLTLEQNGTKLTGTVSTPHGDAPVEGEFKERNLKFTASVGELHISFEGHLEADGTLKGTLSSEMGDMKWSAERKDKP